MLDKLRADCMILLDDGARDDELRHRRDVGRRCSAANPELIGTEKPFIRLQAGRTTAGRTHASR